MRTSIYLEGLAHKVPIPSCARVGSLVMSGSIHGRDLSSGTIPDSPREQFQLIFANAEAMLKQAGGTLASVAFFEISLPDRALRSELDPVWVEVFPSPDDRPARHVSAVPGGRIEARFTAFVG
jgi:2-iminobutanoate/2-iminopropanoate deaminase